MTCLERLSNDAFATLSEAASALGTLRSVEDRVTTDVRANTLQAH
jgi:hypothetical protein